jgi:hypothetical protein
MRTLVQDTGKVTIGLGWLIVRTYKGLQAGVEVEEAEAAGCI